MSIPLRVLIVEDAEDDARLAVHALAAGGYAVTWERVETAEAMRAALDRQSWDVILCDYRLPHFDAPAAIKVLEASGQDLPLIIVSGTIGEEVAVEMMKSGAHDYLMKGKLARLVPAVQRELREAVERRQRRCAEANLLASEVRFRRLFESSKDGILILNTATGTIVDVNPVVIGWLAMSREEILGRKIWDLKGFEGFVRDRTSVTDRPSLDRGINADLKLITADGRCLELEVTSSVYTVDHHQLMQCSLHDATARRESDRRLREQAQLLDKATEAIVVADREYRITFWNHGAELLLGWTAAEALGMPISEAFSLGTGSVDIREAIARDQDWRGEIRGFNRRGDFLTIETRITLIRDDDDRPTAYLCISADLTERKNLEERFLRAQRMESIGLLAAGIAHDMNNVLTPIRMAAPVLRSCVSTPEAERMLKTVQACADHGAGLVRQILGFAHGVSGEPRVMQVKPLLRDVAGIVSQTFPKNIVLEEHIPRDLWTINGSPTQIHQVLLNLCVNARDAMPNGGKLRLRGENCILDEAAAAALEGGRPGAWLVLEVGDTGTGIAPEVLAHMWEPFFTTKGAGKGTGLGLSTVRGIIETHHGFATVRTEVNRGTTIRIYFPAEEPKPAGNADDASRPPFERGHHEFILLADDEETVRETAGAVLSRHGYRVILARDGVEAVSLFASHAHDIALVLTDLDMPGIDGAALAGIVHQLNPAIKVVAMSGLADDGTQGKVAPPGLFAPPILIKPFSANALLNTVQQFITAPVRQPEQVLT